MMFQQQEMLARCSTLQAAGLFYTMDHGQASGVALGESPARVVVGTGGNWKLDKEWLAGWLLGDAPANKTPFVGLHRLLPGQELWRASTGALEVRDTTGPEVWPEPDLAGEDAERALVEAIDSAVAELVADDREVACELSGGLDSSFVVASLAARPLGAGGVRAFTHVPSPEALLRPGKWVASDAAAAHSVAEQYAPIVQWSEVYNVRGRCPLDMAREVSGRAWWPAFGPANLEWLDDIRSRAARAGLDHVWVGSHGNAAFSVNYTFGTAVSSTRLERARRRLRRSFARNGQGPRKLPDTFLRKVPDDPGPLSREDYLLWLAGHRSVHSGLLNADAFEVGQIDPFRHPLVLETAARIRPEGWRREGMNRGLARSAGRGRVPDAVRLRVARGAQSLDVWHWVFQRRSYYFQELADLADIDWMRDIIDVDAMRLAMSRWPWGDPEPPSLGEVRRITRFLAFGRFVRDMDSRLANIARLADRGQQRSAQGGGAVGQGTLQA